MNRRPRDSVLFESVSEFPNDRIARCDKAEPIVPSHEMDERALMFVSWDAVTDDLLGSRGRADNGRTEGAKKQLCLRPGTGDVSVYCKWFQGIGAFLHHSPSGFNGVDKLDNQRVPVDCRKTQPIALSVDPHCIIINQV